MIEEKDFVTAREPNRILLSWMPDLDESNSTQSRTRRAIGEVKKSDGHIGFNYLTKTIHFEKAQKEGFVEFPAFPYADDSIVYSNCMDVFSRRIVSQHRSDFNSYLNSYAINHQVSYSDFALLALTGGRNATDTFEFIDPLDDLESNDSVLIEVAGVRHFNVDFSKLEQGDAIYLEHDSDNVEDEAAMKIMHSTSGQIGWVNRLQAKGLSSFLVGSGLNAKIFRLNGRVGYRRIFVFVEGQGTEGKSIAA